MSPIPPYKFLKMTDRKIGIFEEECPLCKSLDLDFGVYEPVDEQFKQDVSCNKCDFSFTLWANKPEEWEIWADDDFFHIEGK